MTSHTMKIKLAHGLKVVELRVPADSDFKQVKAEVLKATGVPVKDQKLLLRGREVDDGSSVYAAGLRDNGKLMLIESEERRRQAAGAAPAGESADVDLEEEAGPGADPEVRQAEAQLATISKEVDKLQAELEAGEGAAGGLSNKDCVRLQEMLTRQLLALDNVASSKVRDKRKAEVNRVNALCDRVENLLSKM